MTPDLFAVASDGFRIDPEVVLGAVTVKLSGSCDSSSLTLLDRFLAKLHGEVVRCGTKAVTLDCQELYFMNSASVKSFVSWLTAIKRMPANERYPVRIRLNANLPWQQRSFGAIGRSAPQILSFES
jgi:hypothetical protein